MNFDQLPECKHCYLRSPLFNVLSESELTDIQLCRLYKNVPKGQHICIQGNSSEYFIYLLHGLVKVYITDETKHDHIVCLSKPLDFVGLFGIFHHEVYPFSITTVENSTVCMLPKKVIVSLTYKNSHFSVVMLEKISAVAEAMIMQRIKINQKNLRGRLAMVLLDFASNYNSNDFELPVSRREIGELIDMTTENIIRIMSEFRRDGIIAINGKRITLLNPSLLQKISEKG